MRTRIITAVVALCVLAPVLIFSHTWLLPIAVTLCCLVALHELFECVGNKALWVKLPIMAAAAFLILGARAFCTAFDWSAEQFIGKVAVPCALLLLLYLLAVLVFGMGRVAVSDVAISGFFGLYIIAAFCAIVFLRDSAAGEYTYLLVFIGAWVTDSFAYFTGLLFGKHKLIPKISPKKTVEGSLGGMVFCGGAFVLYGIIVSRLVPEAESMNLALLFGYGIVVSVVSQIGDLCMSALKRQYDIKDFGKLFPGHGGVLDRFDSILAVSLVLFVLNGFAGIFG